ncbi:MAG: hypothetical protein J6X60_10520, partial [Ruminiclostridium sp.]|nr:hypothetical protein [Ruminiclostridium sp.]
MKKIISAAAVIAAMGMLSISAFAETVNVTISDGEGKIVVANQPVETEDIDGDGAVTINDALFSTHEQFYDGGAEAGYASGTSEYGIMLQKLWGVENGGNYGYYVNDSLAMSLGDKINDGDNISAYIYQDTATYSDVYCYFDTLTRNEVIGIEPD